MNDHIKTGIPIVGPAPRELDANNDTPGLNAEPAESAPLREKLIDAQTPGYQAEFDPIEAEAAGAFREDALTEADALASTHDHPHLVVPTSVGKP